MAGVELTGFVKKTLDEIRTEVQAELDTNVAPLEGLPSLNYQADSVVGNVVDILADKLREQWDVQESTYGSFNAGTASGQSLNNLLSLLGFSRNLGEQSEAMGFVNLDGGATIAAGAQMSQSSSDERWELAAAVSNLAANRDKIAATFRSVEFDSIFGSTGTIDTIETPTTGWSAKALQTTPILEDYALVDGQTLTVSVDGGTAQTATFNTGDFVDIANATASEVAAVIDTDISGATSFVVGAGDRVGIESDTEGTGSTIEVTGGTANTALGFPTTVRQVF